MTSEKKVNAFEKAAEDRRNKFIIENDHVADEMLESRVEPLEIDEIRERQTIGLKSILTKTKPTRRQCSYYLDTKVDDFFMRLAEATSTSKSEIVNQVLMIAISNNPDIQELAKNNKKINKILREFYD